MVDSASFDASGDITFRFRIRINPLTLSGGRLRLMSGVGGQVRFTTLGRLDGAENKIIPERVAPGITAIVDGVESVAGKRLAPARFTVRGRCGEAAGWRRH